MENNEQKNSGEKDKIEVINSLEVKEIGKKTPRVVNLFKIGTVNVYHHDQLPKVLKKRYEKHYQDRRHHLWFDFILLLALIMAISFNIFFVFSSDTYFSIQLGRFPILTITRQTTVGELNFQVTQFLRNKTTDIINLNEEIEIDIEAQNLSNIEIKNIELVTKIIGSSNYNIISGNLNNKIDKINKEEKIINNLRLKITDNQNAVITIQSQAIFKWQGEEKTIEAEPLYLKLNSEINFLALAKYYTADGDQLGLGSLPPEAGKKTSFWIFWPVASSFNDLAEAAVSGVLPSNVNYTGKSTVNYGSALQFNSQARKITWPIGSLEKNKNIQAGFEVEIIPTLDQQGLSANLLENITLHAKDAFTGKIIELNVNNIATDIIS